MIIFDLDGTLLDVWRRYFIIFNSWWNLKGLDINSFINLKRKLKKDFYIVNQFYNEISKTEYDLYLNYKKKNLENPELLMLDESIINWNSLKKLDYIILTVRHNETALYQEFKRRNLGSIIPKIIVLKPSGDLVKYRWVKNNLNINEKIDVVGDSETDLLIGKLPNIKVTLVKTGLRDVDKLIKKYEKDVKGKIHSVDSVNDFLNKYF